MIIYLLLFVVGLVFGSFLNVVVLREVSDIEKNEEEDTKTPFNFKAYLPSWVIGRSFCPKCGHNLAWYENIPLFSFLFLRGKCLHCKQKISLQYPVVELFIAFEFVWLYWMISQFAFFTQLEGIPSLLVLGYWLFIFSISIALALIDLKTQILPDSLVLIGIVVSLIRLIYTGRWEFLISAFFILLFFLFLFLITKGKGVGFGDVKLSFFIGLVLGWWQWIIVAMFIAFLTGAVVGVILILFGEKTMKSAIPFGPFLLGGMLIAKIWGEAIWFWYIGLGGGVT